MNRRQRIREGMGVSGGTTASEGRRSQIKAALGKGQPKGIDAQLPGNMPAPKRFPSFPRVPQNRGPRPQNLQAPGKSAPAPPGLAGALKAAGNRSTGMKAHGGPSGVGGAVQPKLGAQLSQRVQSGAIDQSQAQTVARQRQMLKKAFGQDWRSKVFGAGGAKGISGPFAQRQVAAKRTAGLERAKKKLY